MTAVEQREQWLNSPEGLLEIIRSPNWVRRYCESDSELAYWEWRQKLAEDQERLRGKIEELKRTSNAI